MFRLAIVTPERIFYDSEVKSLIIPGTEGYLGILSNHAPLITTLKPGKVEFRDTEDKVHVVAVTKGFIEVSHNRANLLCDAAEDAAEIDLVRARRAYERCKQRLGGSAELHASEGIDIESERLAMERAANRIRVYKETH